MSRIRTNIITNRMANGAPVVSTGLRVTGVCTATSFSGDGTGLVRVGASVKIIQKRAKDLTKLLLPYKPTSIISELADYKFNNPDFNIEKVHFYPLGGIKQVSKFVKEI